MHSTLNIGIRHILPIFPFLILLAAGGACALIERSKRWSYAAGALLAAHCISSLLAYPNYLAYANEAWGGPSQTHRYLTDSSVDWGQQLIAVKSYVDQHNIHDCWFAYFVAPAILPRDYGIPCKLLPTADTAWFELGEIEVPPVVHGPVFISYSDVYGYEYGSEVRNPYQEFVARTPAAVISDGVAVYNGDYSIPMARAISHVHAAWRLSSDKKPAEALKEAEAAVSIDPGYIDAQRVLGQLLQEQGRNAEAADHYNQAMAIARTMDPSAQQEPVTWLSQRIAEVAASSAPRR
jgi:tetratricopeptide (TPR) repeat protein